VTEKTLKAVFEQLALANVNLRGIVLKPSMVDRRQEGGQAGERQKEVAEKTLKVLKAAVPAEVPGIAFLSGGQSDAARCRLYLISPPAHRAGNDFAQVLKDALDGGDVAAVQAAPQRM
jgi:fructose-bisphosphate aldolase class 1